jgi:nicotinamidase/pyrazinamidase
MKALLLIDLQNDFLPGGALAVPEGDEVIAVANQWIKRSDFTAATADWHPPSHGSFAANHPGIRVGDVFDLDGLPQVAWPIHCVAGTNGAEFSPDLDRDRIDIVVHKGTDPLVDSYSGFFDNGFRGQTELDRSLKYNGVKHLTILGLATDYCVKFTVLDALRLGYDVDVVVQGCRGVNLKPDDVAAAWTEMERAGAKLIRESL